MYFKRGWVKILGISRSLAASTRISLESNIPSSASFMLLPKPWTCPGFPGPHLYFYMTRVPNAAMLGWESFIIVHHQSHRDWAPPQGPGADFYNPPWVSASQSTNLAQWGQPATEGLPVSDCEIFHLSAYLEKSFQGSMYKPGIKNLSGIKNYLKNFKSRDSE